MSEVLGHSYDGVQNKPLGSKEDIILGTETTEKELSVISPNLQKKLEKARWDETNGNKQEEYDKFLKYTLSLDNQQQQILVSALSNITPRALSKYIKQNGYIIEKATFDSFISKYGPKGQTQIIAEQKKNIETHISYNDSLKQATSFVEIFAGNNQNFSDIPEFQKLLERARSLDGKSEQEITRLNKDIRDFLSNSGTGNLEKISKKIKDSGDEQAYEQFKTYATSIDSTLGSRFIAFEVSYNKPIQETVKEPIHQAQIVGGLGTKDFQKHGNIVEAKNGQDVTRMDISEVPPTRYVAIEGSNYSLETDVPIGDFYSAISNEGLEHEKKQAENTPKLEALDKLGSPEVQEFLQSSDFEQATLSGVKAILSSMIGLSAGMTLEDVCGKSFTSKEDIKNFVMSGGIASRKKQLEDQIKEKETKYKLALKQHVAEYSRKLKEKDETTRNTLRLMKQMGMDLIPQGDLEQLIAEINLKERIDLGDGIRTNTDIDLAEGVYGFTDSIEGNSDREKEVLVRLFNKMVTGESTGEDSLLPDVTSYATNRSVADPVVIRAELEKRNIITNTGSFNIAKVRENLWGNNTQTK